MRILKLLKLRIQLAIWKWKRDRATREANERREQEYREIDR